MRILLLGEYSNVHATLAKGLRLLGHEVTVASNGDFWKGYERDIDLFRRPGKWGGISLYTKVLSLLPRWRGYDVVQLINPMFMELRAERLFAIFNYLRQHNGIIVLGAFGMDWYWVNTCVEQKPLRYSDFNIGSTLRTNADALRERADWIGTTKEKLNKHVATACDGIVAGLYEYWVCYQSAFPQKTVFIPYPMEIPRKETPSKPSHDRTTLFIGINKTRSEYKGTDIMLAAAQKATTRYPERLKLEIAESLPFDEYKEKLEGSDVMLDQLYSYTPSMNALLAMSKGIVCVGGGEPENYEIIGEHELRPILNVTPTYESVFNVVENIALHPERLTKLKEQSIAYVRRHHDYVDVARRYEDYYTTLIENNKKNRKKPS